MSPNDGRPGGLQEALLDFVLSFSLVLSLSAKVLMVRAECTKPQIFGGSFLCTGIGPFTLNPHVAGVCVATRSLAVQAPGRPPPPARSHPLRADLVAALVSTG